MSWIRVLLGIRMQTSYLGLKGGVMKDQVSSYLEISLLERSKTFFENPNAN